MRKDQIFVLLLVILLPLSGCFDGAVGEAEADDSENHSNHDSDLMYSISQMADENTTTGCQSDGMDSCYLMYQFTTNATELVEVVNFYVGGANEGGSISTDCGNGFKGSSSSSSGFLPFSDRDCEHTIRIHFTYSNGEPRTPEPYFSLVYQIHEVTVVTE